MPTFSWTYTDSERELTETDPLYQAQVTVPPSNTIVTIGQKSYQYDSYGRVSQLTLPEHYNLASYTYDDDDEVVQSNANQQIVLNARGEMIQDGSQLTTAQGPTYMANGTQVGNFTATLGGNPYQAPPATLQYDVRSGMVTCGTNPNWVSGINQSYHWIFNYDAAGRQTNAGYDQNGSCTGTGSLTTTYDAENHIHKTYNMIAGFGAGQSPPTIYGTVDWGPDGRQRSDHLFDENNNETSFSAHWDGDTMLFSRYQVSGATPVLYIGKFAAMSQAGDFEVIDRDESSAQQTEHGVSVSGSPVGNWYDSWSVGTVRSIQSYNPKAQRPFNVLLNTGSCGFYMTYTPYTYYPCPIWGPHFSMKRADGYTMIGGIVQGVRTYDPTSGQWLTPDAYAGDVHDPMSQKPFVWNNNNPVAWSDPSGYIPEEEGEDELPPTETASFAEANTRAIAKQVVEQNIPDAQVQRIISNAATPAQVRAGFQTSVALRGATPVRATSSGTQIYQKPGGMQAAKANFAAMQPTNVTTYRNGTTVGELANGDTVNIHQSTTGDKLPTLEIEPQKGPVITIRFTPQQRP